MTKTGSDKPSYYAVIPAPVRYDETLVPNAKLLYGEITALANKKGYCWASNGHFAELYQVHTDTVSEWVSQLAKSGYILLTTLKDGRRIHLAGSAKMPRGLGKNAEHNNKDSIKDNNREKEAVAIAPALSTFSLEETLKKWEDGNVRRLSILAWFIKKAKLTARTAKELDNIKARYIRSASRLEPYTDEELVDAWKKSRELGDKLNFAPTLETVLKQLTQ
jgi:DNA-binding transcriptional regulator YiaG